MPVYDDTMVAGTMDAVSSQPKPPGTPLWASVASKCSNQPRALCEPKLVSSTPKKTSPSGPIVGDAVLSSLTQSILVNSEDGVLYRWSLASNSFTQCIRLTAGLGEAYTPTAIGADGAVYAVNNAMLFSIAK